MVDHNNYYFNWEWRIDYFMIDGFNIDTIGKCVAVIFITFLLALLHETMKHFQKVLNKKIKTGMIQNKAASCACCPQTSSSTVEDLHIPIDIKDLKRRKIKLHAAQSLLYMVSVFVGFILMDIAMDMYIPHFMMIVIGGGLGYCVFNAIEHTQNCQEKKKCNGCINPTFQISYEVNSARNNTDVQ